MKMSDIRISDTIVVRDWDDMVSEYAIDKDGDIVVIDSDRGYIWHFVSCMRCLCGKEVIVTDKNPEFNMICVKPVLDDWDDWDWNFCPEMFREQSIQSSEQDLELNCDFENIISKVE